LGLPVKQISLPSVKNSPQEAARKREEVRRALIAQSKNIDSGVINRMADSDLRLLFELYDAVFLERYFAMNFAGSITFSLSARMSKSAGKTIYPKNLKSLKPDQEKYELRMGIVLFFKYDQLSRDKKVNGLRTGDSLEAFQLVFEHELCHLIELHFYRESNCKRERFKTIARNLFGHTESYHQLPTSGEIAEEKYNLRVGDRVVFTCETGKVEGVIQRINKRATVMVPDKKGDYRDQQGQRYAKWYVPLPLLKKK
jgi:predicted SprT family Zn-dependent metalloprotease